MYEQFEKRPKCILVTQGVRFMSKRSILAKYQNKFNASNYCNKNSFFVTFFGKLETNELLTT